MSKELDFSKEEGIKIKKLSLTDYEFKKNLILITDTWRLQKIGTQNAVDLIKQELKKAEKRDQSQY